MGVTRTCSVAMPNACNNDLLEGAGLAHWNEQATIFRIRLRTASLGTAALCRMFSPLSFPPLSCQSSLSRSKIKP